MKVEAHPELLLTRAIDQALCDVSSRGALSGSEVIDVFLDLRLVADEIQRLPWCELRHRRPIRPRRIRTSRRSRVCGAER